MWGAPAVMAACGLLIPMTSAGAGLAWYVAGALPLSLGVAAFNVCVRAAIQTATPDAMLGRVTATVPLFTCSAIPAGALTAGAVASLLTPRIALAILMGLLTIAPAWLLLSPIGRVRDVAELAGLGRTSPSAAAARGRGRLKSGQMHGAPTGLLAQCARARGVLRRTDSGAVRHRDPVRDPLAAAPAAPVVLAGVGSSRQIPHDMRILLRPRE
jgi:hypothetical protein